MATTGAAAWLPSTASRRRILASPLPPFAAPISIHMPSRAPLTSTIPQKPLLVVASAQFDFSRAVQTAWRVGNDAVEAGSNLVPGSVPRPIARIGVAFAAVAVTLFLVKSVVSTALFVLAMALFCRSCFGLFQLISAYSLSHNTIESAEISRLFHQPNQPNDGPHISRVPGYEPKGGLQL